MNVPESKSIDKEQATPRPKGRPRAFDRVAALDRAMHVFWQRGYEGSSMPVLTREMGISAQSLYATFHSKAELYREALERYRSQADFTARAYDEESEIWEVFRRVLYGAAEHFTRPGNPTGCMLSMELLQFPEDNASLADAVRQMRADSLKASERRIRKALKAGQLAHGTNTKALARLLYGAVLGMAVQARDGASRKQLEELASLTLDSLAVYKLVPT